MIHFHHPLDSLSAEQIREALLASAELVDRYGEAMLPYYEFFEQQYLAMQTHQSAMARARALLSEKNSALSETLYIGGASDFKDDL